jgi:chitinase
MKEYIMQKHRRIIALCAAAILIISAVAVGFIATRAPKTHASVDPAVYGAAPYVMPIDNNPPNLSTVMSQSGVKAFTLAFILAENSGCTPAWDGTADVGSDSQVAGIINTIRSAGGDVVASVGGYGGTKLGQVCGSADATAAAYQKVISKYSLKAIDFDLEEPEYENTAAINNELGAAKILQANNPGLVVQITTAGTTSGTGYFGQNVLNTAKSIGFTPTNFTIMPFDGGFNGASSQVSALQAFNTMLMNTFSWDSATAYNHEGFSGMNGRSDSGEMFTLADFNTILNFAQSNHMSKFTFWSVNRDRQCSPPDNNGTTSGTCSSTPQNDWDFSRVIAKFSGVTPPPPNTPPPGATATPTSGTGNTGSCAGVAAYSSSAVYTNGMQVVYNNQLWQAKWWTQGETPSTGGSGVWTLVGSCGGSGSATATPGSGSGQCAGVAAYSSSAVYTNGMKVVYNNQLWQAKWWTQGEAPSTGGSGVWSLIGSC